MLFSKSLKVDSSALGSLEIERSDIIVIPRGMIDAPDLVRYCLIEPSNQIASVRYLQSVDCSARLFATIAPESLSFKYRLDIARDEDDPIDWGALEDPIILLILHPPDGSEEWGVDLKGPIVIDRASGLGAQLLNETPEYEARHRL